MEAESGGYDAKFVDEPPEYFICIICHLALRQPVLFVDCGHRVCTSCFKQIKTHAVKSSTHILCPHDRIKIDGSKVFEDKGITRAILDLQVRCDRFSAGCNWVGELRNLSDHLKSDCRYGKVDTTDLLQKLLLKVELLEGRSVEKETEIVLLKERVMASEAEISGLKKCSAFHQDQISDLREHVHELNKQLEQQRQLLREESQKYSATAPSVFTRIREEKRDIHLIFLALASVLGCYKKESSVTSVFYNAGVTVIVLFLIAYFTEENLSYAFNWKTIRLAGFHIVVSIALKYIFNWVLGTTFLNNAITFLLGWLCCIGMILTLKNTDRWEKAWTGTWKKKITLVAYGFGCWFILGGLRSEERHWKMGPW